MVLCAALAACSNADTQRTLTAPDAGPRFSEAPADIGFGVTADGPLDVYFGTGDGSALQSAAQVAAAPQGATGSRTSGHVGLTLGGILGLASERYSFTAQSTGAAPTFPAKGEFEMQLTAASGVEQKFHGNVICMSTVGNTSRLAGQLEKVWINNVQFPISGATHVIWTVVDNGEGHGTADSASPMFFNNSTNAQTHCSVGFLPPQFPNQNGNVQVR